jgi:hypothetical protein
LPSSAAVTAQVPAWTNDRVRPVTVQAPLAVQVTGSPEPPVLDDHPLVSETDIVAPLGGGMDMS